MKKLTLLITFLIVFSAMFISCDGDSVGSNVANHTHSWVLLDNGTAKCSECGSIFASSYWGVLDNKNIISLTALNDGTYTNTSGTARNVVIYTTGETLTINAPNDTVTHYGSAADVIIIAIASDSYHYKANVSGSLQIRKGHIVLEKEIGSVAINATDDVTLSCTENGSFINLTVNKQSSSIPSVEINGSSKKNGTIEVDIPVIIDAVVDSIVVNKAVVVSISDDSSVSMIVANNQGAIIKTDTPSVIESVTGTYANDISFERNDGTTHNPEDIPNTRASFTITFHIGDSVTKQYLLEGDVLNEPVEPSVDDNHVFSHWKLGNGSKYLFGQEIYADLDLYAVINEKEIFDPQNPEVISKSFIELGTTTETINNNSYTVKSFVELLSHEDYFYTYYKFYYSSEKLKRIDVWHHGIGSCLLYPYTDFSEHFCTTNSTKSTYTYYDNGHPEYWYYFYSGRDYTATYGSGYGYDMRTVTHYNNEGYKESVIQYVDDTISSATYYYTTEELRDHVKTSIQYKDGIETNRSEYDYYSSYFPKSAITKVEGVLSREVYYSSEFKGKTTEEISYSKGVISSMYTYSYFADGTKAREERGSYSSGIKYQAYIYSYYPNGRQKSYERRDYSQNADATTAFLYYYFDSLEGTTWVHVIYNSDETINYLTIYYESRNKQYDYSSSNNTYGKFDTYDSDSSSSTYTRVDYSDAQIKDFLSNYLSSNNLE